MRQFCTRKLSRRFVGLSSFECYSRHLGFAKHGELGRVKEGEEGGGVGGGINFSPPSPSPSPSFLPDSLSLCRSFALSPSLQCFPNPRWRLITLDGIFSARSHKIRLFCMLSKTERRMTKQGAQALKPWSNGAWKSMIVETRATVWPPSIMHYHQLSFTLNLLKFPVIVDDSFSRLTTRIVDDS